MIDRRKTIAAALNLTAGDLIDLAVGLLQDQVPESAVRVSIDTPLVREEDPRDPSKLRTRPTGVTTYTITVIEPVDPTTGEVISFRRSQK